MPVGKTWMWMEMGEAASGHRWMRMALRLLPRHLFLLRLGAALAVGFLAQVAAENGQRLHPRPPQHPITRSAGSTLLIASRARPGRGPVHVGGASQNLGM